MSIILSLQGSMAVGKTTTLKGNVDFLNIDNFTIDQMGQSVKVWSDKYFK